MRRHHVFHSRGVGAAQMQDGFNRFHLNPRAREFQTARADARLQITDNRAQPVWHPAQRHPASGTGSVFHKAFDSTTAFAFVRQRFGGNLRGDQRQQFRPTRIAHHQPLIAIATHIAHRDIGQPVGVIDAGFTRHREKIGGQLADGQRQKRHKSDRAAIVKAQLYFEISAKFQITYGFGFGLQQVQKTVEIFGGGVVGTRRADDIDPLEPQLRL